MRTRPPIPIALHRSPRRSAGFTLTEMLVAIAVLLIVIIATGKIFGTASQVTGVGQATSGVLQEAAAFERRLREDFTRLTPEGFFAIRNVAVPNGINAELLDPRRAEDAVIRADQLVFFTTGVTSTQVYAEGDPYADRSQQSLATRVYYGHAFQVPELSACQDPRNVATQPPDYAWYAGNMVPWHEGTVPWIDRFGCGPVIGDTDHLQLPAAQWLLARQAVLLADDGGDPERYFLSFGSSYENAAAWLYDDFIRNSRRDIAASQLDDLKRDIQAAGDWDAQRDYLGRAYVHYPRAERTAPDMPRQDFALTTSVISAACSSIEIEWTYRDGVGFAVDAVGAQYHGAIAPRDQEQPWFGLKGELIVDPDNEGNGLEDRTLTFEEWQLSFNDPRPPAIEPTDVERLFNFPPSPSGSPPVVYEAVFGYNRTEPFLNDPDSPYTPWPTAIRVTLTLHDPDTRLAAGSRYQFVIDLPRRGN